MSRLLSTSQLSDLTPASVERGANRVKPGGDTPFKGWRNHIRRLTTNHVTPSIPLSWAATTPKYPYANLGDALSPVIVSTLSALPIVHRHFDSTSNRFACVGTIGQNFRGGTIHLWGTGVDGARNPTKPHLPFYQRPPSTKFVVHALRGPFSAQTFRRQGIEVPDIYGDPVWFLPAIIEPSQEQPYELGVVVHLTELSELSPTASTHELLVRYQIPPELSRHIRIINTLTEPSFDAIAHKVREITSCKRILSTSLHGLVIAEAYRIPCLHLRNQRRGVSQVNLEDETEQIDQRMRDFYRGAGLKTLTTYDQRQKSKTRWDAVIQAIDRHWSPLEWNPEAFLEAFPLPLKFNPLKEACPFDYSFYDRIVF